MRVWDADSGACVVTLEGTTGGRFRRFGGCRAWGSLVLLCRVGLWGLSWFSGLSLDRCVGMDAGVGAEEGRSFGPRSALVRITDTLVSTFFKVALAK